MSTINKDIDINISQVNVKDPPRNSMQGLGLNNFLLSRIEQAYMNIYYY